MIHPKKQAIPPYDPSPGQRLTIEKMQQIAKVRGGVCLSDSYGNNRTPLQWQCARKHQWHASPKVTSQGHWCRLCIAIDVLEELQRIAGEHGGRCLSDAYVNAVAPLLWECTNGHRWHATSQSIARGHWCVQCLSDSMRGSLEQMQALAQQHGGQVLSTTYIDSTTKLRWRCANGHTWETKASHIVSGSWCPTCYLESRRITLEDAQQLAISKGGRCLSDSRVDGNTMSYVDGNTMLTWQCADGHIWQAPAKRFRRTWCAACKFEQKRLGLPKMQELAAKHGGRCLSDTYKNVKTSVTWQCIEGHTWESWPTSVQKGAWCPECRRTALDEKKKRDTRKKKKRFSLPKLL